MNPQERQALINAASAQADRYMDTVGMTAPVLRQINELYWAVSDLQDAHEPKPSWMPLQN